MIELNAQKMTTAADDQDWGILKRVLLARVDRCMEPARQEIFGRHTLQKDVSRGGLVAMAYAQLVLGHANVIRGCVAGGEYSSGFALLRPMLEALLKQWLASEEARNKAVDQMVGYRQKVCKESLERLRQKGGLDVVEWWTEHERVLNDFVHGGFLSIANQKSGNTYDQIFPADWVWQLCTYLTQAATGAAAQAFHVWGYPDKVKKIYELVAREGEWLVIDDMLNETPLRATCHSPDNQE